jgi:hypothetical protein
MYTGRDENITTVTCNKIFTTCEKQISVRGTPYASKNQQQVAASSKI